MDLSNLPNTCVETAPSGNFMDLANPLAQQVSLTDIAASLGRIARFTGHCLDQPETVAEHSLLTDWIGRYILHNAAPKPTEWMRLHWLLHDAHEAYTGDISTPMKRAIGIKRITKIQDALDRAIYGALHLRLPGPVERAMVCRADKLALRATAADTLPSQGRWAGSPDTHVIAAIRQARKDIPVGDQAGRKWLGTIYALVSIAREHERPETETAETARAGARQKRTG